VQRSGLFVFKLASSAQRAFVCFFFLASLCAATDLTGVISDNTGTAIAGISVTVALSSVDGPLPAAEAYSTSTAADGSFAVKGLAAGPFIVCADGSGLGLLDPCEWGSPAIVRLPAGTGAVATTTQLVLGATVSIRVDDPALLLFSSVAAGQPTPFLVMGVWDANGHYHQSRLISSDSTGHNFSSVVLPNAALGFTVNAQNVAVANAATGSAVTSNQQTNVNLAPGATLQLHYSVSASVTTGASPNTNQ
jgi:hypothetical protein